MYNCFVTSVTLVRGLYSVLCSCKTISNKPHCHELKQHTFYHEPFLFNQPPSTVCDTVGNSSGIAAAPACYLGNRTRISRYPRLHQAGSLLVLAQRQPVGPRSRKRPPIDEKGRHQPRLHRLSGHRRRALRKGQVYERPVVERAADSPPHSRRPRHRDRHLQLPRLEPVGRPVGEARTVHALPEISRNSSTEQKRKPYNQAPQDSRRPGRGSDSISCSQEERLFKKMDYLQKIRLAVGLRPQAW